MEAISGFFGDIANSAYALWSIGFFIFWGFLALVSLIFAIQDRYIPIGILWVFVFVFLLLAGDVNMITLAFQNPGTTALCVGGYLGAGFVWVTFRWLRFAKVMSNKRIEAIRDWLKNDFNKIVNKYNLNVRDYMDNEENVDRPIDPGQAASWRSYLIQNCFAQENPTFLTNCLGQRLIDMRSYGYDLGTATEAIRFKDHKRDYSAYFFYWPVDMVVYGVGEVLTDVWNTFVHFVQGTYDSLARKIMFKGIKDVD